MDCSRDTIVGWHRNYTDGEMACLEDADGLAETCFELGD